jgi:cell wall-associated NlpC family hydrolase
LLHAISTKEFNMKRGDHLVSSRLGYDHHGLYIGNGEVIHYSGFSEAFDKGSIEKTAIDEFTQGNGYSIKSHLVCVYDAEERVERAFSKLGEDSYNLIFNNCEHFVNWCFNGFKTSSQVNNAVSVTATLANEYIKRKGTETAVSVIAQQATRTTVTKTAEAAVTSVLAKSAVSTTAGTAAGVTAASAVTSTTAAGIASVFAAGSVASVAAPVAIAVGVGYGVKKVFDWLLD